MKFVFYKYQPTAPYDTNYWQQEAQKYAAAAAAAAAASVATPPPSSTNLDASFEAINVKEEEEEKVKDENDEEGDHQVDLDTRLKMLMKGKAGAAMPSFLLDELNGSENEEESEGEIKDEKSRTDILVPELPPIFQPDPLLSRPPSPFLSEEHYQKCHESWQNDKRQKFNALHNIDTSQKSKANSDAKSDDRMSLSSLSSGENNILQQGPLPNYYGYYPPPPGYDHQSWYTQQYMQQQSGNDHPPGGGPQWQPHQVAPHQQHYHQYQNQNNVWQDPYHSIRESLKSGKSDKNVFRPVIK